MFSINSTIDSFGFITELGEAQAGPGQPHDGSPADHFRRPLILIADDQPGIRDILSVVLSPNYRIAEAADGQVGLTKATELFPDAVITDVVMPNMNGIELLRAIRQHPQLSSTPVISMSGYEELTPKTQLLDLGICAHLTKPFSILEVPALVEHALGTRNGQSQPNLAPEPPESETLPANPCCKAELKPEISEAAENPWVLILMAVLSQFAPGTEVPAEFRQTICQLVAEIKKEQLQETLLQIKRLARAQKDPHFQHVYDQLRGELGSER